MECSRVQAEIPPRCSGRDVKWTEVNIELEVKNVIWSEDLPLIHQHVAVK